MVADHDGAMSPLPTPWLIDESPAALCNDTFPFGILGITANGTRDVDVCLQNVAHLQANASVVRERDNSLVGRRFRSCAVVGSSGRLLNQRLGDTISAHEAVWRFNIAPASPAEHVGNRTTVSVTTSMGISTAYQRHVMPAVYCGEPWWSGCLRFTARFHVPLINPVLVRSLQAALAEHPRKGSIPSAGLVGLALARQLCSKVSVFGFSDPHHAEAAGTPAHYWNAKSHGNESDYFRAITKPRGPFHEWENQWRLIERWRRSEAIRVY